MQNNYFLIALCENSIDFVLDITEYKDEEHLKVQAILEGVEYMSKGEFPLTTTQLRCRFNSHRIKDLYAFVAPLTGEMILKLADSDFPAADKMIRRTGVEVPF